MPRNALIGRAASSSSPAALWHGAVSDPATIAYVNMHQLPYPPPRELRLLSQRSP